MWQLTLCFMIFFFFKQKTAYEMRISDWSSDLCSSDLAPHLGHDGLARQHGGGEARVERVDPGRIMVAQPFHDRARGDAVGAQAMQDRAIEAGAPRHRRIGVARVVIAAQPIEQRSEERRGGDGCVSTCRSGWWAYN